VSDYNLNDQQEQIVQSDCLDALFTVSELKYAVYSQNNSKSSGEDHLIADVFKHSFDIISPFLLQLYNKLFTEGIFPETWQQGIIDPIFKLKAEQVKQKTFEESH
jgi:hypothetical protein